LTVSGLLALLGGVGLLRRRPGRWIGPFFQVVAISAYIGLARGGLGSTSPIVGGIWLATILLPGVLALAHPDGIVEPWARRVVLCAVVVTAALAPLIVLAAHGRAGTSITWWDTRSVRPARPLARVLFDAHALIVIATVVAISAWLVRRSVRADRAFRRLTNPVTIPALVWAVVTVAGEFARMAGPRWALGRYGTAFTAPATFLLVAAPLLAVTGILAGMAWVELIEPGLQRATAGFTGGDAMSDDVTAYLGRALGDPSVKVFFRQPGRPGWLDGRGRAAWPAIDDRDRAITIVERDGVEVGAIEYDASLTSERDSIELAVTAAALALDSARLTALASARTEGARRVAAQLVTSADTARNQLEIQLAKGPFRELDAIDRELALGHVAVAADRLQLVAANVRTISHGLYPSELTEEGLAGVLTEIGAVPAGRFPPAVEITAFLAADGDLGASITCEPGHLVIALSRPPIDPTLVARVAALGGTIHGASIILPVPG
jgi:hypothetical protein